MVWRINTNSFVAASELQMGDTLLFDKNDNQRSNISSSIRITSITSIPIPKEGYMAPFTPSCKIVVNGIMASSFVDSFDDTTTKVLLPLKELSLQWIAYAFEFPHRMICSGASLFCGTETNRNLRREWYFELGIQTVTIIAILDFLSIIIQGMGIIILPYASLCNLCIDSKYLYNRGIIVFDFWI